MRWPGRWGDRETIRKYIAPAVAAGFCPGGPGKSEAEWQELVRGWFPELADARLRQVTWPAIAEHHDYITVPARVRTPCATAVQRLVDAGFSLKTIGDYAGHRSAASTQIYGKVGIEPLRQVAPGDGEEALR